MLDVSRKTQPTVFVLTVMGHNDGRLYKVYIHHDGQQFRGWCQCLESRAQEFCEHLYWVFSNQAYLVNEQDVTKMRRISEGIKGTPLHEAIQLYSQAELELLRASRKIALCRKTLDGYALPDTKKQFLS